MSDDLLTPRTRIGRHAERGRHDRPTIEAILDEGLVAHVGFVAGGDPYVMPVSYGREGDRLYVHGSAQSRLMRALADGAAACVTVTLLDGLVLARSAFNHSVNYRAVVVLGRATEITDRAEKLRALRVIAEHIVPGRWDAVRAPTDRELDATTVVALRLDEASAKIRSGPPADQERDRRRPVWGGVLPLALTPGVPVPDGFTDPATPVPDYLAGYRRRGR
jgi:nitroimidazol reductase NimA-like FMN-containing flavoprotein (pyridoxamine 5'-phosphate oxidase superfamily)